MDAFTTACNRAFELVDGDADALLLVPPFADLYRPNIGVHLLQACAKRAGLRVRVLYASLLFAGLTGADLYTTICYAPRRWAWGERLFAACAFGRPGLRDGDTEQLRAHAEIWSGARPRGLTVAQLFEAEEKTAAFCAAIAGHVAASGFAVAGVTTTFEQTAAGVALLNAIKRASPKTVTIIGGGNCEGPLAEGVASLGARIDYIFSGECESAFPRFLEGVAGGERLPEGRIVQGTPCLDLDSLPEPEFEDYFAQLDVSLPGWEQQGAEVWLPYESSRGCWWGARSPCTFCGLNGETMTFRQKSPERMLAALQRMLRTYPTRYVCMTDNIMPHSYFRTLLPSLAEKAETAPGAHIFYEVKANLTLDQVCLLKRAGVGLIQPGIESLSSPLLKRMRKGVLARQNIALLRYARAAGVAVNWNLLCDFPGDEPGDYGAVAALFPLLRHLNPPEGWHPLSLDRFSPYFLDPGAYGITNLRPLEGYRLAFPPEADLGKVGYHFHGDYASACRSDPGLLPQLEEAFEAWRSGWTRPACAPPVLEIAPVSEEEYLLMDTRNLPGTVTLRFLTAAQARTALIGGPIERQPLAAWAIDAKLAVELDGWCVPLAIADLESWRRLDSHRKTGQ